MVGLGGACRSTAAASGGAWPRAHSYVDVFTAAPDVCVLVGLPWSELRCAVSVITRIILEGLAWSVSDQWSVLLLMITVIVSPQDKSWPAALLLVASRTHTLTHSLPLSLSYVRL